MGAQEKIPQKGYRVDHSIGGLPKLKVHAVSEINVRWEPTPGSSCKSRSGPENQQIRDPGQAEFAPVTFSCHGNKSDTKAVWDVFDKASKGDPLRGNISVFVVNPKDEGKGGKDILECVLENICLIGYTPFAAVDVDNPDTLTYSFTVSPDKMKFKKS